MFHDTDMARAWLEAARWPNGPYCPHCGTTKVMRMGDGAHRAGLFHCRGRRGQFSVLTGSVMEPSHLPLPKWVPAIHLMTASKRATRRINCIVPDKPAPNLRMAIRGFRRVQQQQA
jgi:transposase-like protein